MLRPELREIGGRPELVGPRPLPARGLPCSLEARLGAHGVRHAVREQELSAEAVQFGLGPALAVALDAGESFVDRCEPLLDPPLGQERRRQIGEDQREQELRADVAQPDQVRLHHGNAFRRSSGLRQARAVKRRDDGVEVLEALLGAERDRGLERRLRPLRFATEHPHEAHGGKRAREQERWCAIPDERQPFLGRAQGLVGSTAHPPRHREPSQRRRLGVLSIEHAVDVAPSGAVDPHAGFQFALTGNEIAHRAQHDAAQVVRFDARVDVVVPARYREALVRNLACPALVATHEVEGAETPQRPEADGRLADRAGQLARARECRCRLGRRPAAQRDQRVTELHLQLEFPLVALARPGHRGEERQPLREVRRGLRVGGPAEGAASGALPPSNGVAELAGLGELHRDVLRLCRRFGCKLAHHRHRIAPVVLLAGTAQQAFVRRLADQRVLEHVGRVGRRAALVEKLGLDQVIELAIERGLVQIRYRTQQRIGKLATQRRAELCERLAAVQTIEASHQRVLQRHGDGR